MRTTSGWPGCRWLPPLAVDPYHTNRVTGSFVVIDEPTNATVAAAMVGQPPVDGGAHLDQGS